ncbi:MAG TPA: class I adenylate-forming enzyme family protein [Burkholderiales bacterium]|nr:class I adenylate-forming enzyme family protein [Burkholderiales bacterium]
MEAIPHFPDYPPTLPNMMGNAVERFGDREFLVDGPARLTYRQADAASAHLARGLLALGVGKATRVAVVLPDCADWVLAWWAAARIGALTIPLSTFFQAKELGWALKEADVDTLIIVSSFLGRDYVERLERAVPGLAEQRGTRIAVPGHPYLRNVVVFGDCSRPWAIKGAAALRALADATPAMDAAFLAEVERQVYPADLFIGICTSGSTSQPKIVVHTHGSVIRISHAFLDSSLGQMSPDDRNYSGMPLFWLGGLNANLFPAIFKGACMVFAPSPKPENVLDVIVREKVTRAMMWPVQYKPLTDLAASRGIDLTPTMHHLHVQRADGSTIPPERRIVSLLGMTESFGPHGQGTWDEELPEKNGGTFGRRLRGVERKIVDPRTRRELPPRQDGELMIRGFSMMQGYYKRERADTFDADGWFATGDTCAIDEDGHLYFRGRLGDMIKTTGANVSPLEVEAVMMTYPGVAEAVVVGLPDPERGERVAAVVIAREGESVDPHDLRRRMLEDMSSYKVPKDLFVMKYDEVPRTTTGKVHRIQLKELLARRQA